MSPARFARCLFAAGALLAPSSIQAQDQPARGASAQAIDAGFQKFWAAASPVEAAPAAAALIEAGVTFDEAVERLKAGRTYAPQPPGVVMRSNRGPNGVDHNYAVNVPLGYDPARRYQLRFQLHGGIGARTDNKPRGTGEIGPLAGAEQFYVLPYAWTDSPWWSSDEVLNLNAIVDSLKRTYNIDENRVVIAGVSDGATGAYYIAMHDTTPYASFLPLNGFIMVLANGEIDDGRIFPNNLRNKPLFVVNGGRDRLYPTGIVEPLTNHLRSSGVQIDYHPQPEGEHNTKWWPELKDTFEQFVAHHPRDPHPDTLSWDAADPQGHAAHNRAHWLVLDEFGPARGEAERVPDVNLVAPSENEVFPETDGLLFGRAKTAGHVDLVRTGNTVQAVTRGVTAFTLLLSPDKFDFRQPVKVVTNGREVFHAMVSPSVKTLLTWAARDNDRTMLYGAELRIKLAR
jgi:predicted esterase